MSLEDTGVEDEGATNENSPIVYVRLVVFIGLLLTSVYLMISGYGLWGAVPFVLAIGFVLYSGKTNDDVDFNEVVREAKKGASSTPDESKIADVLDNGESVEYLMSGRTIDVEGSGTSVWGNDRDRKSGTKGAVLTAMTDKRVVIKVPQFMGDDERTIPYGSITSVDMDTGMIHKRISLRTAGQTYHIEVLRPDKEGCREAIRFIRKKMGESTEKLPSEDDPIDQLTKLKQLHDEGVLTETEFAEQKERLLNKM